MSYQENKAFKSLKYFKKKKKAKQGSSGIAVEKRRSLQVECFLGGSCLSWDPNDENAPAG